MVRAWDSDLLLSFVIHSFKLLEFHCYKSGKEVKYGKKQNVLFFVLCFFAGDWGPCPMRNQFIYWPQVTLCNVLCTTRQIPTQTVKKNPKLILSCGRGSRDEGADTRRS